MKKKKKSANPIFPAVIQIDKIVFIFKRAQRMYPKVLNSVSVLCLEIPRQEKFQMAVSYDEKQ